MLTSFSYVSRCIRTRNPSRHLSGSPHARPTPDAPLHAAALVVLLTLCAAPLAVSAAKQSARTKPAKHRLMPSPATVAWGYYSADAKPVLTIKSGDEVNVETLLTSLPARLEVDGFPPEKVEASLRAISTQVTDKGPGGHILTGPIYIEGAEPGDVLEVRIRDVQLALDYGYNGCSGFVRTLPPNRRRGSSRSIASA